MLPISFLRFPAARLLIVLLAFFMLFIVLDTVAMDKRTAVTAHDSVALEDVTYSYLPSVLVPSVPTIHLEPFATGFSTDTITDIAHAGDERLFVAQRNGIIRIVRPDGTIQPTPFLDISGDVSTVNWEEGLLGMVFHPDFPQTPYLFVTYTSKNSKITIARLALDPDNHNIIDRATIRYLMVIDKPPTPAGPSRVHNGGDMAFGPDGYLYIALGDGGPDPFDPNGVPGDPFNHGQRRDVLLGKLLRIDVDPERGLEADCGRGFYSIPPDNPYLGDAGCDEIWALGFRNPWRFSFDRLTGDLYIADVGEWIAEEINYQPAGAGAGANYGWHCREGIDDYTGVHPELAEDCDEETEYLPPTYFYDHSFSDCSVVGGFVYRGQQFPALSGYYLFGDFCTGRAWTMIREAGGEWSVESAGETGIHLSTFGEDVNGELYAGSWLLDDEETNTLYHVVVQD
jgi:glucose/arabinose dehydrogenase